MGKIIKGRFGKPCEDCDGIISAARLRLMPKTKRCIECQEYEDKRKTRAINRAMLQARMSDTIIVKG